MDTRDEFTEAMYEHMQKVNIQATQKIKELREEIKALRAELKDRDPQLWELAEEICCLQLKLASLQGVKIEKSVGYQQICDALDRRSSGDHDEP